MWISKRPSYVQLPVIFYYRYYFFFLVDQFKKLYFNRRVSQSARHVYNCLSRLFLILFLSFWFLSIWSISLKDYIRTHVYLNAPIMFYIYPSFLISDTIFTLFVDPSKKLYLNSHLSQTTRHVLQIAVIFYFRCDFYPPHRLVKDIIFVPTSVSKRPPCFIYTCQFLYPIQFLSFSPIS